MAYIQVEHLMVSTFLVRLRKNNSSLFCWSISGREESLQNVFTPGHNVIKLFTAVIYKCS